VILEFLLTPRFPRPSIFPHGIEGGFYTENLSLNSISAAGCDIVNFQGSPFPNCTLANNAALALAQCSSNQFKFAMVVCVGALSQWQFVGCVGPSC
jgi:hypothetical protein